MICNLGDPMSLRHLRRDIQWYLYLNILKALSDISLKCFKRDLYDSAVRAASPGNIAQVSRPNRKTLPPSPPHSPALANLPEMPLAPPLPPPLLVQYLYPWEDGMQTKVRDLDIHMYVYEHIYCVRKCIDIYVEYVCVCMYVCTCYNQGWWPGNKYAYIWNIYYVCQCADVY